MILAPRSSDSTIVESVVSTKLLCICFFPKIIRTSKNEIFTFWLEIYRYIHKNESQILFENWTKNMSRDIDENFPLTVTNRMSRLRI